MFNDIGEKIKILARCVCWIGIIASVIIAFIMFSKVDEVSYRQEGLYKGLGYCFLFVGPLLSWISSLLLYGFGELVDTNSQIVDYIDKKDADRRKGNSFVSTVAEDKREKELDELLRMNLITKEEYEEKRGRR